MLLFSTILDINDHLTEEAFTALVIEWNDNSPYPENIVPNVHYPKQLPAHFGTDSLWMDILSVPDEKIIAVRYEKRDAQGAIWDSDYIVNFNQKKIAIRLDRSYIEDSLVIQANFSTPYFIKLLIQKGYLKKDQNLDILTEPLLINDDNTALIPFLKDHFLDYHIPVILVSFNKNQIYPFDIESLAYRLKGIAHVLAFKTPEIQEKCHYEPGLIELYYPNRAIGYQSYHTSEEDDDPNLYEKILHSVFEYSNCRIIDKSYTWHGVNHTLLKNHLISQEEKNKKRLENLRLQLQQLETGFNQKKQAIKQSTLEESNALLDAFEQDLQNYQRRIQQLEEELLEKDSEISMLKGKIMTAVTQREPLIYAGHEHAFFPEELKEFVLSAIEKEIKNSASPSRRVDVLQDILDTNDYKHLMEQKSKRLKDKLKSFDGMDSALKKTLRELGFEIEDSTSKHYKLKYYGDDRYTITYGSTPSDKSRAGKNNAQITIKKVF